MSTINTMTLRPCLSIFGFYFQYHMKLLAIVSCSSFSHWFTSSTFPVTLFSLCEVVCIYSAILRYKSNFLVFFICAYSSVYWVFFYDEFTSQCFSRLASWVQFEWWRIFPSRMLQLSYILFPIHAQYLCVTGACSNSLQLPADNIAWESLYTWSIEETCLQSLCTEPMSVPPHTHNANCCWQIRRGVLNAVLIRKTAQMKCTGAVQQRACLSADMMIGL